MSFSFFSSGSRRWLRAGILALALAGGLAPRAHAQSVAVAEIDGYVTDPSGQAIAGAQVTATETDKHQIHVTVTEANGRYALPNLPVGPYELSVSYQGFKAYVQKGITLQVANNIEINVSLQIGSISESIQVTANAAMVETKENSIAQVIDQQRVIDLPLNGRNPTQLLQLTGAGTNTAPSTGGVSSDLTGSKNMGGSNASGTFSVAGGQANGVNFLLDGGDNNDAFSNVNLPIPFPDAIQEFNVQTNGLPAQYGLHPGGVVNIVTKSGANAFHGDLFEFLRNGDLNARQDGTLARDSLKRSQFGGTAGGRIIKDKLFFFGGYQGTRQRSNPATQTAYTPTEAALSGNFSVLDAAKSAGGCLSTARTLKDPNGNPYPGNQIPVTSFDPAAVKLVTNYIPISSSPCGLTYFGYLANNPDDQWIGRVDYIRSDKQSFYARYYIYDYIGESLFNGTNALTTGTAGNNERSETMTIGDTYTVSPTAVNSFHATFDRRRDNRGDAPNLFSPSTLGVNMYDAIPNYTQISVSNYFNVGCGTCAPGYFDVNTYQLADDFTWIRGRHQFGFGIDARKDQFNSTNNQQDNGQFTFGGGTKGYTGDDLADLLTGKVSSLTDGNVLSDYLRQTVFAAYAQDAFHVTTRLTINFGLRWEPSEPAYDKYGRGDQFSWSLFDQGVHSTTYPGAPAGLIFAPDSQNLFGKALTASHWDTFSPRLGLVWDPTGSGRQTLRASFGLLHETTELFYPERWTTNPPYASSITLGSSTTPISFSNPFATYVSPTGAAGDPFPGVALFPAGGTYISIPPNLKPTYTMQWNVSYQRQIASDWLLQINYLGNATRHIWGSYDANYSVYIPGSSASTNNRRLTYLANPSQGSYYGDIEQTDDGADARYQGLLASIQHRLSKGVTLLSNFTYSHCISQYDFGGELTSPIYQNPLNRNEGEEGSCSFDHRMIFNTSLVATSPGVGNGIAKLVTKNWQVSPIISLFTGQPLTLTDSKDISLSGQNQDRPNVVNPESVYSRTQASWFNQSAFLTQPTGTFGDLGRDAIYGPGTINWDMAFSRQFQFKERYKLDVRSDFFNIMNHGNWNNPTTSITSGSFGVVTAFSSPRIIQMSMKLFF